MPRPKSENFDPSKYVQQYMRENVIVKKVSFSKIHESDLLKWIGEIPEGFSTYVKRLIRDDMEKIT